MSNALIVVEDCARAWAHTHPVVVEGLGHVLVCVAGDDIEREVDGVGLDVCEHV